MSNVLPVPVNESAPQTPEEIRRVINRAIDGDRSVLPALRKLLEKPAIAELCGNLVADLERTLIDNAGGKDLVFKEGLVRNLERIRSDLVGDSPTPLERLLAERIAICWLHLHTTEINFARKKELTVHEADYYQRAISACQRRYQSAIRTLAVVQRLAKPVVQLNIVRKQQVNTVQTVVGTQGTMSAP